MYSSHFLNCDVTAKKCEVFMVVKIWACHCGISQQSSRWLPMFHEGHACFIFRVKVTIERAGSPMPLVTTTKTKPHSEK